jgi:hypothetical protein
MLNHVKEVVVDSNEINYNFVLDWYAYMCRGGKNKTILYFKAAQGVGKSTLTDFIRIHVIGEQLSLQSGSQALRSNFNAILAGKLFVTFEELENFSINDWANISSTLKRWSTSDVAIYEKKGIDSFSAENINNYNCISNHDSIKDDQGRRYFKSDVSSRRVDDVQYFDNIYDNCFNDEVGEAFYNYLMERDLTKYDNTRVPITQAKLDSFANRLCPIASFLKDVYIMRKEPFFGNVGVIYKLFYSYCDNKGLKNASKIDFCKQLREWNLDFSRHANELRYKISYERLLEHANKQHWIHETDEFIMPKVESSHSDKSVFKKVEPKVKLNVDDIIELHKRPSINSNRIDEINDIIESIRSSNKSDVNSSYSDFILDLGGEEEVIEKQDSEGHVDITPDIKLKSQMEKILKYDKPVNVIPKRKPTNTQNLEESELPKDLTEFCENILNF